MKKFVGYLRYDSQEELDILNDLYRKELRLYKNFFQPQMKLVLKERIEGKIHRKYDKPKTPYQRVMDSKEVPKETKLKLKKIYNSLNPAKLKKAIDTKLDTLYQVYQVKHRSYKIEPHKKLKPISVRYLIAQPEDISVR